MKKNYLFLIVVTLSLFVTAQLPKLNLVTIATGFNSPIDIKNCGDNRIFIVEQAGYIRIMDKNGNVRPTPFLDIHTRVNSTGNEQGLLTVAFSPNYKQDGYFYINYIYGSSAGNTRISRFQVSATDSNYADQSTEQILLTFVQPFTNHNGATLMFGKDGYLYDTQGDGGSGGDPYGNGQNTNVYLAKILRFDVSNPDTTYIIPPTNPFYGQVGKKGEIWAYGVRNPWRCSMDRITGDLWIGDVGQNIWEEVDFQSVDSMGGQNYGWNCREGAHPYNGCVQTGFKEPIFDYNHSEFGSCAITGGYVYRGAQFVNLWGKYLFADYCSGVFWTLKNLGGGSFDPDTLSLNMVDGVSGNLSYEIGTFGEDNEGEIYIGGRAGGAIYHLTDTVDCHPVAFISFSDSLNGCRPYTISALQSDSLAYQWYNSAGSIGGATSYQYTLQQDGWYKIKTTKSGGCFALSDSVYVTLHDTTAITTLPNTPAFCINQSPQSLSGYPSPAGGVFTGVGISGNNFDPIAAGLGVTNVTYNYSNNFGCSSNLAFPVTVNDTTAVTSSGNPTFCITETSDILTGYVSPTGGSFTGTGVSGANFNPSVAGIGVTNLTYQITNGSACISTIIIPVTVGGLTALVRNITDSVYCNNSGPVNLDSIESPNGGTYSGTGVTGSNFNPSSASIGANVIHYDYTNPYGCVSNDSFVFTVNICGGIPELANNISFNIFPNPSNGVFNLGVWVGISQQTDLIVTNAIGQVCYKRNLLLYPNKPVIQIELTQLAKGVYSVQLKSVNGSLVKSLVIE